MQDPYNITKPDPAAEQKSPQPLTTILKPIIRKPKSEKQIQAARVNGMKSKGPTTPEGRLKCSTSAQSQFKHTQLAETVLLTGESTRTFTALLQRYIDTFQPMTEPEHNVIQKMVVAYWQHLRSWSTHQTSFNCEIARQDATHPHNIKASDAERLLSQTNHQQAARNQAAFDRQYRNSVRDLILLRKLRGITTGLDHVPVPLAASVWNHPDSDAENE